MWFKLLNFFRTITKAVATDVRHRGTHSKLNYVGSGWIDSLERVEDGHVLQLLGISVDNLYSVKTLLIAREVVKLHR